jgi:5-methyltetrahydropteroyltriglutamate--homocysteine methyltransferase
MQRSTERILTSHTGSLVRPPRLAELWDAKIAGKDVDDALAAAVREAVDDAVRLQVEAGIDLVSDGEMGKAGFTQYVADRMAGWGGRSEPFSLGDMEEMPDLVADLYGGSIGATVRKPRVQSELRYTGQAELAAELETLREAVRRHGATGAFVPAASPGTIVSGAEDDHYGDYEKLLFATAEAMREEYRAIIDAGFILQLDAPDIPMAQHARGVVHQRVEEMGYARYVALHVDALNHAVEGLPADRMRMHLCWGNYAGPHHLDVPLAEILPEVLRARPAGLSFEAANPRHEHEWRVFERGLPDDKILMPGVIDTKTNVVEHPQVVADRIVRFAELAGRERVIAGTDCGFGTFVGFGLVHGQVVPLKLRALAEGAALASERLWR